MILVIDNYDSFTYNLVDQLYPFDQVQVFYPDDNTLFQLSPDIVVISPGPGHPNDTEHLANIIQYFNHLPILGICLGAQALYSFYGGTVNVGQRVMHGKLDQIQFESPTYLYHNISEYSDIMRYHSLVCDENTLPSTLKITGKTEDAIQSFEHQSRCHVGIQYHPESFACPHISRVIQNFITMARKEVNDRGTT